MDQEGRPVQESGKAAVLMQRSDVEVKPLPTREAALRISTLVCAVAGPLLQSLLALAHALMLQMLLFSVSPAWQP